MTVASTIDRAGDYDALATAKSGEPLFPLQGGDPFAWPSVMHWVGLARAEAQRLMDQAAAERSKRKRDKLIAEAKRLRQKANNAEEVAWEMQEYLRGETADEPETVKASYSGNDADPERKKLAALVGAADRIYNSIAELTDAADMVATNSPEHESQADALRLFVDSLKDVVAGIEPRRHLPRRDM